MPTSFKPILRPAHGHGHGLGKGIGTAFRLRNRKLPRDNILAISKGSLRKLARRGGIRRIQSEIYDEARAAIKAYLTTILHRIVLMLESDGPAYEVETMHRTILERGRKTVMVHDVVFALKAMGSTLYGFGWYDSGIEPTTKRANGTARNAAPSDTSSNDGNNNNNSSSSSSSSDEASMVG